MGDIVPLECRGDAFSMGRTQGEACRATLAKLDDTMLDLFAVGRERRLGRFLAGAGVDMLHGVGGIAKLALERDLRRHLPQQRARMAGIAAGGAIPASWLWIGPGVEMALNRVSYVTGACTALAVTQPRSGEPIIAKNFDYPDAARDAYLCRISRPSGGAYASIDITASPLPGSHEGVNEHGLAIAYNYGYLSGKSAARIAITHLVQHILERCRTVYEAITVLRRTPRAGSALLMIADAEGDLVSVELAPDDLAVRSARNAGGALCHANHSVTSAMAKRDVPHDAFYSRFNPAPVRGERVHQSSEARHQRAETLLDQADQISELEMMSIVADHAGDDPSDDTICRHGDYYKTTCSVLLYPRRRALAVMFDAPCTAEYTIVSL